MELLGVHYTILDIGGLGADGFTVTLRDVIMRKYRINDPDVFAKAYSYVEQYY